MDWNALLLEYDWIGHVVEAFVIAAVVAALSCITLPARIATLVGLSFAIGHFHGREKRDFEVSVSMPPPHLEGYYFWNWSWDQATDFWPVAIVLILASIVIRRIWR